MFEQSVIDARALTARPWTLAVSLAGQGILITAAVVLPLLHPEVMQRVAFLVPVTGPPAGPAKPVPQRTDIVRRASNATTPHAFTFIEPYKIPHGVTHIQDAPEAFTGMLDGPSTGGVIGGFGTGGGSAVIDSITRLPDVAPPSPKPVPAAPKEPPKPVTIQRIKQGGAVQAAMLKFGPAPEYPPLAKQARISGAVHLSALIGPDGKIVNLHMIDGHPLLVHAAMDAVKRWVYRPTMLNGDPVEVITEITVTFTLN